MAFGIKLLVWGERACFTRPEFKVERVSYDVMTPSAARGILEAIYWKPAIRWHIDTIHVLNSIRFESIRRNEVGSKIASANITKAINLKSTHELFNVVDQDRQQRAATILKNVAYVINAHFKLTDKASSDNAEGKHLDIFNRRARRGQCFHMPCLGVREFPANFSLIEDDEVIPMVDESLKNERDLGYMLHDIDFKNDKMPHFFRAKMNNGVIQVPPFNSKELKS